MAWLCAFHSSLTTLTTSLNATRAFLTLSRFGLLLRGDQTARRASYSAAFSGSSGRVGGRGEGSSGTSASVPELSKLSLSELGDGDLELVVFAATLLAVFLTRGCDGFETGAFLFRGVTGFTGFTVEGDTCSAEVVLVDH